MPFYIGQMSGTSADGIDLCAIDAQAVLHCHQAFPYPEKLTEQLHALLSCPMEDATLCQDTEHALEAFLLEALSAFVTRLDDAVIALGLHGQTLYHDPDQGKSFTLINPQRLVQHLAYPVVARMRQADIDAGGQGAPLAPFFHQVVFSSAQRRAVLNLGGIANLTVLNGGTLECAFDIGPANTLLDSAMRLYFGKAYDDSGAVASSGQVSAPLLARLLDDAYFYKAAPKSTGREYFNWQWVERAQQQPLPAEDMMATLLALSARSIADAVKQSAVDEVIVCGGGVYNHVLLDALRELLDVSIIPCTALGWHPQAVEAAAWAWLAQQCMAGQKINTRVVTGAREPVLLGEIFDRGR